MDRSIHHFIVDGLNVAQPPHAEIGGPPHGHGTKWADLSSSMDDNPVTV